MAKCFIFSSLVMARPAPIAGRPDFPDLDKKDWCLRGFFQAIYTELRHHVK
jgi:hypothetical protein